MGMDAIPYDLLELILLFIASSVFLVRAASTCKQWHRIIANADFLRRYRCLHRPPVAGYYYDCQRFSPSSPSVVDGRHFSLDFLPGDLSPGAWILKDSRGSLLLFDHYGNYGSRDTLICEPVTKRFQKIPPWTSLSTRYRRSYSTAFILDGDNGGISMTCFRVLCLVHYGNRIHAGVFALGDNSWQERSTQSKGGMNMIGVAMGSMYWYTGRRKVVTLDLRSIKFSSFKLPEIEDWDGRVSRHRLAVTAGRDGKVRIVVGVNGGDLKIFAMQQPAGGSCELVLKKRIPLAMAIPSLPWRDPWYFHQLPISNHRTGAVLVVKTWVALSPRRAAPLMFRLDIETMAVERMPDPNMGIAYPCELPWPPVFRACTDHDDRA